MNRPVSWLWAALPLGIAYALVGVTFAWPSTHAIAWRRAAWAVCLIAFAAHIAWEHYRLRNPPRTAARHVAAAAAFGAFGLAVGALVHSYVVESGNRGLLFLALVIFPVITGVPAFVVAFGGSILLARSENPPPA